MVRLGTIVVLVTFIAGGACLGLGGQPGASPATGGRPIMTVTAPLSSQPTGAGGPNPGASVDSVLPGAQPSRPGSYVLELASGRLKRVSDLSGGIWSPDGAFIAFSHCCGDSGYIDIVDLRAGTSVRVLTGDSRDLAWSPDSIHLAYVPMDRNLASIGVYVVDRDGYNPHALIKDPGAGEPQWQDNRRVAYSKGNAGDVPAFFIVDSAKPGSATRLMPRDPPDGQDPRIVFGFPSSDGVWVVYYEGTYHSESGQTLAWSRRTGEVRVLLPSLALGEFAPGTHTVRLFLPDPARTGRSLNQVFDLDSGQSFPPIAGLEAHWSGDGERLVFEGSICENGSMDTPGLLSSLPDGSAATPLAIAAGEVEYGYALSPASPLVALTTASTGGPPMFHLRVATAEGLRSLDVPLALGPHLTPGAWSPDGSHVLFSLEDGRPACG